MAIVKANFFDADCGVRRDFSFSVYQLPFSLYGIVLTPDFMRHFSVIVDFTIRLPSTLNGFYSL
jgi:hypothetical protein